MGNVPGELGGEPAIDSDARPTLSICVPTFRRPELAQRAIRSIIDSVANGYDDVEIIVSDNSPEMSEGACREALASWRGKSLYIGHRPNVGMAPNFDACIARASGDYVLFVHDDDLLLPNAVPQMLRAVATPGASSAVLFFGVHIVDEAQRVIRRQRFCRDASIGPADALRRLLSDNGIAWFPGLVVSRDAYVAVGPFDAESGNATDLEMWVRLFAAYGLRCVPGAISAYSVHLTSATQTTAFDRDAISRILAIFDRAERTGALGAAEIRRCRAQFLPQVILGTAAFAVRSGRKSEARKVMALFDLPAVRSLRLSRTWLSVRFMFAILVRSPSALVRPLLTLLDKLDLVRRVRAVQTRGESTLPFC
jgi:GT2 family glycosyltransferase